MKEFLERYKLSLNLKGPVHIGSGDTLRKSELLYDGDKVIIIDYRKFFDYLSRRRLLKSFEDYRIKNSYSPLFRWMKDNRIYRNDYKKFTLYSIDKSDIENGRIKKNNDVALFIKSAYGKPYIPGSSIKGALRNAILISKIYREGYNISEIENYIDKYPGLRKRKLNKAGVNLNVRFFNTLDHNIKKKSDGVNDFMKGVRVSDSSDISFDNLCLCQKYDYHVEKCRENSLPIYRESLKPGTKINTSITFDRTECDISIDELKDAISDASYIYNERFLKKFRDADYCSDNTIYMGGGTGFASKSADFALFDDYDRVDYISKIISMNFKKNKNNNDKKYGISPHCLKLTLYKGTLMQMGECEISIEKI